MKRVLIDVAGERATVRLFDAEAPRMVGALWSALPIDVELRQSRWSGNSTFAAVPAVRDPDLQRERAEIPRERPASFMCPGRLYAGAATGGLGLPYGESQSRDAGANTWLIEVGELEPGHERLLDMLRRIRREGRMVLRITPAT